MRSYQENPGRKLIGEKSPTAKLTDRIVAQMKYLRSTGLSYNQIAAMFGVRPCTAVNAIKGKSWPHLNTGEADTLVEEWLKTKDTPPREVESCPDCGGSGLVYVDALTRDKGVRKCSHPNLRQGYYETKH